jgi:hypothetical protein
MSISLPQATLAVGALGSAATGLVDTTKVFVGGMSRAGFGYIQQFLDRTVPPGNSTNVGTGLQNTDVRDTLFANWVNGMESGAQKVIAKSFVKMHFNPSTAAALAKQTNVDPDALTAVAEKLAALAPLTTGEADVYGRFDFALSALVDQAYERGDQFYRNCCKALASLFAVALAVTADCSISHANHGTVWLLPLWQAVIIGLISTPLAPVAKDIANAIQTASDAVRSVKG